MAYENSGGYGQPQPNQQARQQQQQQQPPNMYGQPNQQQQPQQPQQQSGYGQPPPQQPQQQQQQPQSQQAGYGQPQQPQQSSGYSQQPPQGNPYGQQQPQFQAYQQQPPQQSQQSGYAQPQAPQQQQSPQPQGDLESRLQEWGRQQQQQQQQRQQQPPQFQPAQPQPPQQFGQPAQPFPSAIPNSDRNYIGPYAMAIGWRPPTYEQSPGSYESDEQYNARLAQQRQQLERFPLTSQRPQAFQQPGGFQQPPPQPSFPEFHSGMPVQPTPQPFIDRDPQFQPAQKQLPPQFAIGERSTQITQGPESLRGYQQLPPQMLGEFQGPQARQQPGPFPTDINGEEMRMQIQRFRDQMAGQPQPSQQFGPTFHTMDIKPEERQRLEQRGLMPPQPPRSGFGVDFMNQGPESLRGFQPRPPQPALRGFEAGVTTGTVLSMPPELNRPYMPSPADTQRLREMSPDYRPPSPDASRALAQPKPSPVQAAVQNAPPQRTAFPEPAAPKGVSGFQDWAQSQFGRQATPQELQQIASRVGITDANNITPQQMQAAQKAASEMAKQMGAKTPAAPAPTKATPPPAPKPAPAPAPKPAPAPTPKPAPKPAPAPRATPPPVFRALSRIVGRR